ncbi:MAG TPA: response regulator transcription factor [Anaerolineaceae bacterium]|nr:response regulator transcription factor [Anaerolineaceae bacterium]
MQPLSVLVADPHALFRDIAAHQLADQDGMQIIGMAGSGASTLQAVVDTCPDVLFLGLDFQDIHGIQIISTLRERNLPLRIIAFGGENRPEFIRCVLDAGADAYLLKDEANPLLVESVHRLFAGEKGWFRPQ